MPADSLSVRHYMSSRFATVKASQDIQEVTRMFTERNVFGAAVVDNIGNLVGIISVTDCIGAALKAGYNPGFSGTVASLMSPDVRTVDVDDDVIKVAKLFMKEPYRRYPVVDDNRVVGVITRLDVLKALRKIGESGVPV